jgi:hypothetical protein
MLQKTYCGIEADGDAVHEFWRRWHKYPGMRLFLLSLPPLVAPRSLSFGENSVGTTMVAYRA